MRRAGCPWRPGTPAPHHHSVGRRGQRAGRRAESSIGGRPADGRTRRPVSSPRSHSTGVCRVRDREWRCSTPGSAWRPPRGQLQGDGDLPLTIDRQATRPAARDRRAAACARGRMAGALRRASGPLIPNPQFFDEAVEIRSLRSPASPRPASGFRRRAPAVPRMRRSLKPTSASRYGMPQRSAARAVPPRRFPAGGDPPSESPAREHGHPLDGVSQLAYVPGQAYASMTRNAGSAKRNPSRSSRSRSARGTPARAARCPHASRGAAGAGARSR